MTTFTWNVSLTKYMFVREKCVYSVSAENPEWCVALLDMRAFLFLVANRVLACTMFTCRTDCKTEASVTSSLYIAPMVERFGIERFKYNVKKVRWRDIPFTCLDAFL